MHFHQSVFQPLTKDANGNYINIYSSKGKSSNHSTGNVSTLTTASATTSTTTSPPTAPKDSTNMPKTRYNPLKGPGTNKAHIRAVKEYDKFASQKNFTKYADLVPPLATDIAAQIKFKAMMTRFADYIVLEARQIPDPTKKLGGGTGKQLFYSFMGALRSTPEWLGYNMPEWYTNMGNQIADRLTVDKAAEGDNTAGTVQGAKTNVKRSLFKKTITCILKNAAPKDMGMTWSKW